MPALALKDNKDNIWEPVGEEMLYAVIKEDAGYMIAFLTGRALQNQLRNGFQKM